MTSIVNKRATRAVIAAILLACGVVSAASADEPVLRLRATVAAPAAGPLTIELLRWSTDEERAPLLAALSAPPPPARGAAPAAPAGRGGRGGRGRGAAPPPSPAARMSAAVKAAPTVGFIWGEGPTGYAIRYAWRDVPSDTPRRIVLVTDRRLGAHSTSWPQVSEPAADVEFTVLEIRFDAKGVGEGKASLTMPFEDAPAQTLALDGYAQAPVLLKVTR